MRKIIFILALVAIGAWIWSLIQPNTPTGSSNQEPERERTETTTADIPGRLQAKQRPAPPRPPARPSTITLLPAAGSADQLNADGQSIADDLSIVHTLLRGYRSALDGNPVGFNDEITSALLGANRKGAAVITADHSAINDDGELIDRWGTPFKFHAISGQRMEVRSAGPDRTLFTEDDAILVE